MDPAAKAQARRDALAALDDAIREFQGCLSNSWDVRLELTAAATPEAKANALHRYDACRDVAQAANRKLLIARALVEAVMADPAS